jgi:hypothetical protein
MNSVDCTITEDLSLHNFLSDIMSGDEDEVKELYFDEHFYRGDE